ncbi:MAG: ATP-binding cassette domain-containing protein [Sphaerochaetaceae bacterium]|nr:ATP-binding cassette domain-containing protein [Sphaerochaetaceae bacterium]
MDAIEIKELSKNFGDKKAVDSLSLNIQQDTLFALLGVNGAGKTTTIKMLSCLSRPSGGDALVMGHSIIHDTQAVKALINVSPQETAIAPMLSTRENLEFSAGIYGYKSAESAKMAQDMIDQLNLSEIASKRARTLSGGWQRRLSIAMSLITEPEVLFLDEPTIGLDVIARRELWHIIENLKKKMTIILTTHYLEEALAIADRIGIMAHGRLMAEGTADSLRAKAGTDDFEEAFIRIAEEEVK